jgi:hypothetical protein
MSERTDRYFEGIPMKSYDLLREGLIVFVVIAVLVLVFAIIFSSPDYPTVKAVDVARLQPVAFLKTAAVTLGDDASVQYYGPPYTPDDSMAQDIIGIRPANLWGVTHPVNARQDFIMATLQRVAVVSDTVAAALAEHNAALANVKRTWLINYRRALDSAKVVGDSVVLPGGDYGPMPVLMNGLLALGRAGLFEGALNDNPQIPFTLDFTRSLLYFQDDVDHDVAGSLDMLGEQWGISHETGPYPGAWWLWPYTFFYQIPPMSHSDNGDLLVALIMTIIFLVIFFLPFIPILKHVPGWIPIYRIIWRDWYAGEDARREKA